MSKILVIESSTNKIIIPISSILYIEKGKLSSENIKITFINDETKTIAINYDRLITALARKTKSNLIQIKY